ncbi:hypothetical protein HDU89_000697 [Geranomyces variabilis]|nr:hypothetical protein HDU89_000697 [Geranomyces variabilis]
MKGACRSVKFSPTGADLLLYSEQMSYVNVVDAVTFNGRQPIRVAPSLTDKHISGISFSPCSKTVFVGMQDSVWEYAVDTARPESA